MDSQERFEARRLLPGMAKRLREASGFSGVKLTTESSNPNSYA